MVSPTRACWSSLTPAVTNPTSPAESCSRACDFGVNTPTCSHRWIACVHHEKRPFARGQRARYFVGEIDVTRSIDEIQVVGLPVARSVLQRRGLRLDGDAALALQIHRIEHLLRHFALRQPAAALDETVCERRLAVIDMGDDRKIADVLHRPTKKGAVRHPCFPVPRL